MEKKSITIEELKTQVEVLCLEEKQKTKFLMEEWKKLCEEKREEKRLEADREEKRLNAEREHELELRRIELERTRLEIERR